MAVRGKSTGISTKEASFILCRSAAAAAVSGGEASGRSSWLSCSPDLSRALPADRTEVKPGEAGWLGVSRPELAL